MKVKKNRLENKILINVYKLSGKLKKNVRSIDEITFSELEKIKSNTLLIDVRSVQEYNEGHLTRAINIPIYNLKEDVYKHIKDRNSNIVLYCQTGSRSKKASKILKEIGFNNVYNLKGGLDAI